MKKTLLACAIFAMALGAAHAQTTTKAKEDKTREDSATAHVDLASSYYQAGRIDVALEELNKVLAQDPKNSLANNLLGVIYLKSGDMGKAETALQTALASDPSNGNASNNYGMLLCKTGRYDAGMEAFGKALQAPKGVEIAQTLVNGGQCLTQKGDEAGAEKFFLKALEQEPFMPAALYQLAKVYYATQRYPQAESRLVALHKQVDPNAASTFLMYQVVSAEGKTAQAQALAETLQTRFAESAETKQLKTR